MPERQQSMSPTLGMAGANGGGGGRGDPLHASCETVSTEVASPREAGDALAKSLDISDWFSEGAVRTMRQGLTPIPQEPSPGADGDADEVDEDIDEYEEDFGTLVSGDEDDPTEDEVRAPESVS